MAYNYESGPFCKAILTGLFAGLVASVSCLIFDLVFRYSTTFPLSEIINISTIIFIINLIVLIAGLAFFYVRRMGKAGIIGFISVFMLVTVFCLFKVSGVERSDDPLLNHEFRSLLSGIVIITGLCSGVLIPFLFYNKGFNEYVV